MSKKGFFWSVAAAARAPPLPPPPVDPRAMEEGKTHPLNVFLRAGACEEDGRGHARGGGAAGGGDRARGERLGDEHGLLSVVANEGGEKVRGAPFCVGVLFYGSACVETKRSSWGALLGGVGCGLDEGEDVLAGRMVRVLWEKRRRGRVCAPGGGFRARRRRPSAFRFRPKAPDLAARSV